MKVRQVIAALLTSAFIFSISSAQVPRGPQGLQAKSINLNKVAFNESLSSTVGPKSEGLPIRAH